MISLLSRISAISLTLLILSSTSLKSQRSIQIHLETGVKKIEQQSAEKQVMQIEASAGTYCFITFSDVPDSEKKEALKSMGIDLQSYIPKQTYYASISKDLSLNNLQSMRIFAVNPIWQDTKVDPSLLSEIPEWAMDGNTARLIVSFFGNTGESEWQSILKKYNAELFSFNGDHNIMEVGINQKELKTLAEIPSIYYIQAIDPPGEPENFEGRTQHRSNSIAADYASGLHYDGSGVSIAMYDDGAIGPHIDYEGRLPIQFANSAGGEHGDHVSGTIMGAGNLDPKAKGMAFGADLYVYNYNGNSTTGYDSVPSHYNKYNVNIISTSYSNGCNAGYTAFARKLDQHINQLPSLMYVFSAGNNGTSNCSYGAGSGWGNITGGHKQGKNVITVGNLSSNDFLASSSSRGPAKDGRIKPDICAKGTSVFSAMSNNSYRTISGTSMACPGIAGSLGQLYHAYKDFNSNQNPPSGLIKGIVLNTADDLGNPGPDFKHGWGRINSRRAFEVIEGNQYITATISSGSPNTHSISVPAGVKEVRIMTYWHDYEASVNASPALVNNLDMTVTDPSSNVFLPWVLNPAPNAASLDSNAKRAVDSLNNMEQVTIENPTQGNYTVSINPTLVPQGPQQYFVIYAFIFDEIVVTYPNGGEGLVPGESTIIRWDAADLTGSFAIEYTTNGGTSWSTISGSVSSSLRQYTWATPSTVTDQARIRISRGLVNDQSDTTFNIIGVPSNLQVDWICPDSLKLTWNNVTGAAAYTAYMLGTKYMDSVGSSGTNSFVFRNTKPNKQYWVSVSANPSVPNTGRRAVAIQTTGITNNCALSQDALPSSFASPNAGTYLSCFTDSIELKVYVKNSGINPIQNFGLTCSVNGGSAQNQTITSVVQPGDSLLVTFPGGIVPTATTSSISCRTTLTTDQNKYNDTNTTFVTYLTGTPEQAPWEEDFETFIQCGQSNNCEGTNCKLHNGWHNDSNLVVDDIDWRTDNAGTPSNSTGPSTDHNPGQPWGNYLFTEASISSSQACTFRTAQMLTPCFDLTEMSMPRFTFWYHMYGQYMGELHVDLLTESGYMLDIIPRKFGDRGDVWLKDSIDLTPYAGQFVSIRFRGITGAWLTSDMALDDMALFETDPYIGIDEMSWTGDIKLYPNPSQGIFMLEWLNNPDEIIELEVTDMTGKVILNNTIADPTGSNLEIDLSQFENGLYFLKINYGEHSISKKLVKI